MDTIMINLTTVGRNDGLVLNTEFPSNVLTSHLKTSAMDLNVAKAIVLTSMFVITFCITLVPIKMVSVVRHTLDPQRRQLYKFVISLLNCFGGGVFLGACLLDLFPEVRDNLSDTFDELQIVSSFPFAEFVMVFGFFLAFIVEQIVLSCQLPQSPATTPPAVDDLREEEQPLLNDGRVRNKYLGLDHSGEEDHHSHSTLVESDSHRGFSTSLDSHVSMYADSEAHSTLRSIVLLLALSLHSVFEGLAIGLQESLGELVQILAAVLIHKSIIAFTLGLNLVQSKLRRRTTVMLNLLFSLTTPVGTAIGLGIMGLTQSLETALINGVLQGIACGTFLFVTFFEVLPHEMNSRGARLPKVLATIIGFAAVCGALFLDPSVVRPSCYRGAQPVHQP